LTRKVVGVLVFFRTHLSFMLSGIPSLLLSKRLDPECHHHQYLLAHKLQKKSG
jgi:hypothetical protein